MPVTTALAVELKQQAGGADSERASVAAASVFRDDLEFLARSKEKAVNEHANAAKDLETNRERHRSLAVSLSNELESIRHRVTTTGFASRMGRSISWYAILFGVVIMLGLMSDPPRWITGLLGLVSSAAGVRFLSRVRPPSFPGTNDGGSIWQRDQLWWGVAFLSAGVTMLFRGIDGGVLIGPWLALAAHLGFLVIPARRSMSQFHDTHRANVIRYVVREYRGAKKQVEGGKETWDALCLDEPGRLSYPADSWPRYGGARIAPGDALVHICEKDGLPYIGYAHGKGFLDWPTELNEDRLTAGFTRRWSDEAHAKTRTLFEQVSQVAADAIPVLNTKRAVAESVADMDSRAKQISDEIAAWSEIYLPESIARGLIGNLDLFARNDPAAPRGILFSGPAGTGKSQAAEVVERTWVNRFIRVDMATFRSTQTAATEAGARVYWRTLRETIKDGAAIIFIDQCESMFPSPGDERADAFTKTVSENFLRGWEETTNSSGARFLVIASTNERSAVDPAFLRRFDCIVAFPSPSSAARSGIMAGLFRELEIDLPVTDEMLDATRGFSGGDLRSVAIEARRASQIDGRTLTDKDLMESARRLRAKTAPAVSPQSSWTNLVISDALRDSLQTMMEMLRNASVLEKQGIAIPRSILLQGPPGTGKTEIARVIATEAGMSFKAYSTAQLKGQYLGQTGANVKKVFEIARASSPAIVYLDEIDIVAGSRGGGHDDRFTAEFLGQILQEMDGITHHAESVFVIASTNSPQTLDDALKSRFEETVTVDLPDAAARLAILNVRLKGKPVAGNVDAALRDIAARASGWSGRDIKNLVASAERGATSRARREGKMESVQITLEDMMAALEKALSEAKA